MPERALPRDLAGAIIGKKNCGWFICPISRFHMHEFKDAASMSTAGFYGKAIKAWSSMSEELSLVPAHLQALFST